jgi:hypothetical protein
LIALRITKVDADMRNAAGRLFLREVFGMRDPQKELLEAQFFDRSNAVAAALAPTTVEEMTMEEHGFYYVGVIDVGPGCLSQALMASMICKDDKRILLPNQARVPGTEHHLLDFDAYAQRCKDAQVVYRSRSQAVKDFSINSSYNTVEEATADLVDFCKKNLMIDWLEHNPTEVVNAAKRTYSKLKSKQGDVTKNPPNAFVDNDFVRGSQDGSLFDLDEARCDECSNDAKIMLVGFLRKVKKANVNDVLLH